AGIAGERAFAAASNAEAVRLFSDALAAMDDNADPVRRARLTRLMGIAHEHIGDYSAANACAAEAIPPIHRAPTPPSPAAREEAMLAYFYFGEAAFYRDAPLDMMRGMFGALFKTRGTTPASQVTVYAGVGLLAGTIQARRLADRWGKKAIALAE